VANLVGVIDHISHEMHVSGGTCQALACCLPAYTYARAYIHTTMLICTVYRRTLLERFSVDLPISFDQQ
jgi:hypothetical protein